jgi:hypothetical protein
MMTMVKQMAEIMLWIALLSLFVAMLPVASPV